MAMVLQRIYADYDVGQGLWPVKCKETGQKDHASCALEGTVLDYVENMKYLGITVIPTI